MLHIIHTAPPMGPSYGGPFQSVRRLAQEQVSLGADVEMRMPWGDEASAHRDDWAPVRVSVSGKVLLPMLTWSPQYRRELCAQEADILHSHGLWQYPSWVSMAWKRRHKKPHVVSPRGMLQPWAWQHKAWKKRPMWNLVERRNLESASLLHATVPEEAEALRDRGLKGPIAIIPNGVDWVAPCAFSQSGEGIQTALFLSRIHPSKGLPLLLEAWAKVRPHNWQLHIAGPDEIGHLAELKKQAAALGIANQVRFSGVLRGEDKIMAFQECDLFILPTHSENFGIVVAEALAHGRPVITTHGAPWTLLETNHCGWWVPTTVGGIASALDDATTQSREVMAEMGQRGRELVAERFAWSGIAQQMLDCYHWVRGEGEKPECVVTD
ncbi:glycosyltransferase [Akkermansiaceae bacterium]|nr:glycosyltransferase [Akkermansiaceae bacterium]